MGISQLVNGRVWGAQSLYADEGKYNTCIEIGIGAQKSIVLLRGGVVSRRLLPATVLVIVVLDIDSHFRLSRYLQIRITFYICTVTGFSFVLRVVLSLKAMVRSSA